MTDENVQRNGVTPAASPPSAPKRQRLQAPEAIGRVLDVETLLRALLALLDLASLANFLEVLARDEAWRGVLGHEQVWREMLHSHFGGKLPAVEQFYSDEVIAEEEEEEEEEEEDVQEEEDDMEEPGLVEPGLIELMGEETDVRDADSLAGEDDEEEEEDDDEVAALPPRPRAAHSIWQTTAVAQEEDEAGNEVSETVSEKWLEGVPSQKVLDKACPELKQFLRSAEQLVQFNARVQIIRGDIGQIEKVGELQVDGLAFPTSPYLRNPHTGAAAVIYQRAGQGLNTHVRSLNVSVSLGQVHVTPGFDAGVDKLLHCVGPSGFTLNCLKELQRTYRNVLRTIHHENLNCVAMTSISTGNNGLPVDSASWFALCAIQRYMRSTPHWTATVGIVCFEPDVYAAFVKSKSKVLSHFNAGCVRANPPFRLL
ncbi:unnamed protein product [Phytophthora fragariaefolia]|uniref:Unnamed protein product n=1 Tax=Phytophthora fragariaefolia TaxID=1490495 RepID=A0A9W6XNN0_9STRA|nr:unnamed protein product [Phytophthora fragariaefolia]